MRVFVIENSEIALQSVMDVFRQELNMVVEGVVGMVPEMLAWLKTEADNFDVIVVNEFAGSMDGLDIIRSLRRAGTHVPLVATLECSMARLPEAFSAGAADVVQKPFKREHFLARVRARALGRFGFCEPCVAVGSLIVYFDGRPAEYDGREINLTKKIYKTLQCLALRYGRVVTREQLYNDLFSEEEQHKVNIDTVNVHICKLRSDLAAAGVKEDLIETIRETGYRLTGARIGETGRLIRGGYRVAITSPREERLVAEVPLSGELPLRDLGKEDTQLAHEATLLPRRAANR
ncbi:response regulator transcription factor [Azospirillum sp. SYSU D00513]|uniref:response regulator transcription factor n=1 Tax=Azospirillum sp. SYSU D00513 TaxID=2812561 RepID=UPI001A9685D9|nr:response regulator transcription factor [Azospirillum sp. SYSU D00513]